MTVLGNRNYTLINQWFASTYNSSNDVLQFVDKEEGVIIGKGQMAYDYGKLLYNSYTGHVNYTIKIQVKDNKFKIEISDFVHKIDIGNAPSCELGLITTDENFTNKGLSKSYHNNTWKDLKLKINKYSNSIFTSIETAIKNKIKDKTEW